ncbi:MAG: DUF2461 domain-containing protein [Saprospiraceae bacterium]
MQNLKKSLDFLIDLKFNNNRNWFNENKDKYTQALQEFSLLVDSLIAELKKFDNTIFVNNSKDCLFRIYKDARFSKNEEPYKTNFGAFIAGEGKKSNLAGYYIHLEPDNSFIGGGIYMPKPDILSQLRSHILNYPQEYINIINDSKFKLNFGEIVGEKLKSAPKGFSKDDPNIELVYNKSYAVIHNIENDFWLNDNLISTIIDIFKSQYEFNKFLNQGLIN